MPRDRLTDSESPAGDTQAAQRGPGKRRPFSPLTARILAVNIFALATLFAGTLYLDQYRVALVETELASLRAEAQLVANALAEGAVVRLRRQTHSLLPELALPMIRRLVETTETRTRLYGTDGVLLADSHLLLGPGGLIESETLPPLSAKDDWLGTMDRWLSVAIDHLPPRRGIDALPVLDPSQLHAAARFPDIANALNGNVSAHIWSDGDGGRLLTAAAPVQRFKQVLGAVLVSRDGDAIDAAVRQVRRDIIQIFGVTLLVTTLLSLYLASSISRPIRRLARAADRVRMGLGQLTDIPDFSRRGDEVGDLSTALRDMANSLAQRITAIERFAADVAHEIKNPLTSLRSAVETAVRIQDPERQARLMAVIKDDVDRLDRLISDISDASRLDAELSRTDTDPVDLRRLVATLEELHQLQRDSAAEQGRHVPPLDVAIAGDGPMVVTGMEDRLFQVFQNILSNAISFSPPEGRLALRLSRGAAVAVIEIADDGPGIPENKLDAIFDRFYSERPESEKFGTHSGLGLSISKQIIEAHQGRITARNRKTADGQVQGAVFTVTLPLRGDG